MAFDPAPFPAHRPRRLRSTPAMRDLVAETRVDVQDLVAPLFVREAVADPIPITSLPGVVQHTVDSLRREVNELAELGVRSVMVFGIPEHKDATGSASCASNGIAQVALEQLRADVGDDMVLIADLCVDEYTDHGHCGIIDEHGSVDNDATLELYAAAAVAQANAGAHMVAPSGMMDGQVAAIRTALDDAGHINIPIMAYASKYASGLYGPFREAVDVTIAGGGDRKGYQQDWRNGREALVEVAADVAQGADIIMVKPAVTYLDVIAEVRAATDLPVAAYHVSGEYAMIMAAAANGWIDGDVVALEQLTAIKRAGAGVILTYLTRWFAEGARGLS
ncbi:MAG: porphobilinogen synthase [Ilumatobacteraceae bacterium]|nr:porphobilinogen synthase [Ilumatobacteraceae bacterium]